MTVCVCVCVCAGHDPGRVWEQVYQIIPEVSPTILTGTCSVGWMCVNDCVVLVSGVSGVMVCALDSPAVSYQSDSRH